MNKYYEMENTYLNAHLFTLRISGEIVLGPLLENAAMKGAGLASNTVVPGTIYAVGVFADWMYAMILRAF